jgi:mannose-6-phosphate isomerase-like protein (cupin superfamily)
MSGYTRINLKEDVEDQAPKFGYGDNMESRFARETLELENAGLSHFRVAPGYRFPFGHKHGEQEEIYVIAEGSARMKLDDDVVELRRWDAVRVPPNMMRAFEGGPEGAEILVFGAPNTRNRDVEMVPNWWSE